MNSTNQIVIGSFVTHNGRLARVNDLYYKNDKLLADLFYQNGPTVGKFFVTDGDRCLHIPFEDLHDKR